MRRDFAVLLCAGRPLDLRFDLRQFPEVSFPVDDRDLLEVIAAKGQRLHGVRWRLAYRHFVTEPDDKGRRYQAPFLTAYVAEDGHLTWTKHNLSGVRVSDVARAREEGLFEGDPYALLIEEPLGGNGALPLWDDLVRLLIRTGEVGAGVVVLKRAADILLSLLHRFRRQWELRGAMPYSLLEVVLKREEWDHEVLARYLGVSLAICVDLLECLGYEQDADSGAFRLGDNPERAALRLELEREILGGDPRENRRWFWAVQGRPEP